MDNGEQSQYAAGVCNIGKEEIVRRKNFGWLSLAIAILLLMALILFKVSPWWRLFVFFPAVGAASGFLQAHFHFCTGFARKGVFNFGPAGTTQAIDDEASKQKDREKGGRINLYAALIGVAVAILSFLSYFILG